MQIALSPVVLSSLNEICKYFKVGEKRVKEWVSRGAPIAVEDSGTAGSKRYSCEAVTLQQWRNKK